MPAGANYARNGVFYTLHMEEMAALHPPTTLRTTAHLHIEPPDDGTHDRTVFMVLRGHAGTGNAPATGGTVGRKRCAVALVHAARHRTPAPPPLGRPRASARAAAVSLRSIFAKRRGLAKAGAARRVELPLEPLVLPLHSIAFALGFTTFPLGVLAFALRARELLAQASDLAALLLDDDVAIVVR
jgi:hypothetical protein